MLRCQRVNLAKIGLIITGQTNTDLKRLCPRNFILTLRMIISAPYKALQEISCSKIDDMALVCAKKIIIRNHRLLAVNDKNYPVTLTFLIEICLCGDI